MKKEAIAITLVTILIATGLFLYFDGYFETERNEVILAEYTLYGDTGDWALLQQDDFRAQTFITDVACPWTISKVGVKGFRHFGSDIGDVEISIREIEEGSIYPITDSYLGLGSFDGNTLPEDTFAIDTHEGNEEWVYVDVRDSEGEMITLLMDTVYAVVIDSDATTTLGFIFDTDCDPPDNGCDDPWIGGFYCRYDDGVWVHNDGSGDTTVDLLFTIYGYREIGQS